MQERMPDRENGAPLRAIWIIALLVPLATVISGLTLLVDDEAFPTLAMPGFYVDGDAGERSTFVRRELVVLQSGGDEQVVLPQDFLGDSMTQSFAAPLYTELDEESPSAEVLDWFLDRMGEVDHRSCGAELAYRRSRFVLTSQGDLVKEEIELDLTLGVVSC